MGTYSIYTYKQLFNELNSEIKNLEIGYKYNLGCPYLKQDDPLLNKLRKHNKNIIKEIVQMNSVYINFYTKRFKLLPRENN